MAVSHHFLAANEVMRKSVYPYKSCLARHPKKGNSYSFSHIMRYNAHRSSVPGMYESIGTSVAKPACIREENDFITG